MGFLFQRASAIVIMLDDRYIKEYKGISVEGTDNEDIELILENGNKVYTQAKAINNPDDDRNTRKALKDVMKSLLMDYQKGNAHHLIYMTNRIDPLKSDNRNQWIWGWNNRTTIGNKNENIIVEILMQLDVAERERKEILDKLYFRTIWFFGDDETTRFQQIEEVVGKFLSHIGLQYYAKQVLMRWRTIFENNETVSKKSVKKILDKKDLMYSILSLINTNINADNFVKVNSKFDDFEYIETYYKQVVEEQIESIDLVNNVLSQYQIQKINIKINSEYKYDFIKDNYKDYTHKFDSINPIDEREAVTQYAMLRIIEQKRIVDKIREAANLK